MKIAKTLIFAAVMCLTISSSSASWLGQLFGPPEVEAYWTSTGDTLLDSSYYNLKNNGKTILYLTGRRQPDGTAKIMPGKGMPIPPGYTFSLAMINTPYMELRDRPKITFITKDGDLSVPVSDHGIIGDGAIQAFYNNASALEKYLLENCKVGDFPAHDAPQQAPAPVAATPAPEKTVAAKPAPYILATRRSPAIQRTESRRARKQKMA